MKKQMLATLKITFFFLLGIFLVWLSLKALTEEQISTIKTSIHEANFGLLALSIGIGILSHLIRAYRWNMLVEPMGYKPRFINSFNAVMAGYLVNYGVPRLGEISRCTLLTKYEKIAFTKTLGTVIAERVLDVFLFFVVFFLMLFTQYDTISAYFENYLLPPISNKINNLAQHTYFFSISSVIACAFLLLIYRFRKKISGKFSNKIKGLALSFGNGFSSIRKVKKRITFILLTFLIWVCYYASVHVCFYCLPLTAHLGFSEAITAFVFGSITVMITPGGIGAYPFALQKILLLVYFVPEAGGASIGWLSWLTSFVLILFLGLFSFISLPILNKNYEPIIPAEEIQTT